MAGEKNSKSVLFGSVAVLAIPAVIYLMGYIYWREYFSCFSIDLTKMNLPVYRVMIGATPGVYVAILTALLVHFVGRTARSNSGYRVSITTAVFILWLALLQSVLVLRRQPKPNWFMPTCIVAIGLLSILLLLSRLNNVRPLLLAKLRDFVQVPRQVDWSHIGIALVPVSLVLFFILEDFSRTKGKSKANGLLGEAYEDSSLVRFRFGSDTSLPLPDSLVLIASSESHYFVFSRAEPKQDKPTVFAVNKNSVSYMEIVPPEKSESSGLKQRDQSGPSDLGPR